MGTGLGILTGRQATRLGVLTPAGLYITREDDVVSGVTRMNAHGSVVTAGPRAVEQNGGCYPPGALLHRMTRSQTNGSVKLTINGNELFSTLPADYYIDTIGEGIGPRRYILHNWVLRLGVPQLSHLARVLIIPFELIAVAPATGRRSLLVTDDGA